MLTKRVSKEPRRLQGDALRNLWIAVAGAVLLALVIAGFNGRAIAHAVVMATTRLPQGYSELSFVTSTAKPLPSSAPVYKDETFVFQIANHEQRNWTYSYQVLLTIDGKTSVVSTGLVPLANGEVKSVTAHFSMPVPSKIGVVSVHISDPSQSIFFRSES